jgi:hypothetical protein
MGLSKTNELQLGANSSPSPPSWREPMAELSPAAQAVLDSALCTQDVFTRLALAEQRIQKLEAQRETEKACIQEIYDKLDRLKVQHESNWSRIVKLEEAAADHFPDAKKMVAPAGGLVERVRQAQDCGSERDARAAILAVAEWLESYESPRPAALEIAAAWLREEVEREA